MLAHNIEGSNRTEDVVVVENITFDSLLLSENVSKGLKQQGFKKPSPIQLKAIPVGRCGFDLIVKSKSGTGKTLVFSIIALESLTTKPKNLEVIILSPTREIAVQSQDVIKKIGYFFEGLKVESFIGGLSLAEDKQKCKLCHIAVGTPGRIKHLISEKFLNINSVRLLVFDEADKLLQESFRNDINEIYNSLPAKKQIVTTSATYPNQLEELFSSYMLSPTQITATSDSPLLLGLKHFVAVLNFGSNTVQQMKLKNEELFKILENLSFTQCLIFTNYQTKAESLSNLLNQKGWPSTFISAAQTQIQRLAAISDLKSFKCRIMLSTDLTSRGIDAANVDLVINYDIPLDPMTYLHRMGRAGRFGSSGICINLVSDGMELVALQQLLGYIGGTSLAIPKLPAFVGSISELVQIEIPQEDCVCSKVDINMKKKIECKIYEAKTDTHAIINLKNNETNLNKTKDIAIMNLMHGSNNEASTTQPKKSKNVAIMNMHDSTCEDSPTQPKKAKNVQIMDMLNDSKNEVAEIKKQISQMDNGSILDSLLNQNFKIETKSVQDNQKNTKESRAEAVKELLSEVYDLRTEIEPDKTNVLEETEELHKKNVLIKNTALLNVTQILSESNALAESNSIEQHLSSLKAQDKSQIMTLSKKGISDILNILEQKEAPRETSEDSKTNKEFDKEAVSFQSKKHETSTSDCRNKEKKDNKDAVLFQSKPCDVQTNLPSTSKTETSNSTIKSKNNDDYFQINSHYLIGPSSSKAVNANAPLDFEDVLEFGYRNLIKSDGDDYWRMVLEKSANDRLAKQQDNILYQTDDDVNVVEVMKWVSGNGKRKRKNKMSFQKHEAELIETTEEEELTENVEEENPIPTIEENTTEEMDVMKWMPVEKTNEENFGIKHTCVVESEYDYTHHDVYGSYFEECSNNLWQNGLSFNSEQAFDDWFTYEWEEHVYSVKNYIQQQIYVSEMAKFQNPEREYN